MKTQQQRQRDQLKAAQERAKRQREAMFGKQRLARENAKAKAYDEARARKVELKTAKLEQAQANAEKLRQQKFGEQKLRKEKAEAQAYEARRAEQVKLKSARLEDSQAKAEEIRRKMFGLEEEKADAEKEEAERHERANPKDEQPPKTEGPLQGKVIGAGLAQLGNQRGQFNNMCDGLIGNLNSLGIPDFEPEEFTVQVEAIRAQGNIGFDAFTPFKRGKFSDQKG